jgi:hypothetical protein
MGKLGQLLVARGWITVQQLNRALQTQQVVGGRLGSCLLEMDALSEELLLKGLSEQLGVPAVNIDHLRGIPDEVLQLIPDKLARRCRTVPFRVVGSRLDVAMMDPRNLASQDEIAFASGKRVMVHVAHELRILEALERYYREETPSRVGMLVERLNRARYFWERQAEAQEAAPAAAAPALSFDEPLRLSTLKAPPLPNVPGAPTRRARTTAVPPAPALPTPSPTPPTRPTPPAPPARSAGPVPAPAPRPVMQSVSLTDEEKAELDASRALGEPAASAPAAPVPPVAAVAPTPAPPVAPPAPVAPPPPPPPPVAAAPAPAPPAPAPAPPPPAPATFAEVEAALASSHDREEVGRIVLGFLAHSYRRAALFQVVKEKVSGWIAEGEIDVALFQRFSVTFDQPSLFLNLRSGNGVYLGPMPPMPAHLELARAWGGELPKDCVMLPVRVKDRLVSILYADGATRSGKAGLGGVDLSELQRLGAATGAALERCILHRKRAEAKS